MNVKCIGGGSTVPWGCRVREAVEQGGPLWLQLGWNGIEIRTALGDCVTEYIKTEKGVRASMC